MAPQSCELTCTGPNWPGFHTLPHQLLDMGCPGEGVQALKEAMAEGRISSSWDKSFLEVDLGGTRRLFGDAITDNEGGS